MLAAVPTSGIGSMRLVTLAAAGLLAACSQPVIRPSASRIEATGLITEQRIYADRVEYRLESGQIWEGRTGAFRTVMDWGAKLLVAGWDADGRWVATFGTQAGLPDTCYFTPERGTDWGDTIAIAGVLWPKAPGFAPSATPAVGSDYPAGTRFCLDPAGQIASIIPN
jgi:hypothetical protein